MEQQRVYLREKWVGKGVPDTGAGPRNPGSCWGGPVTSPPVGTLLPHLLFGKFSDEFRW